MPIFVKIFINLILTFKQFHGETYQNIYETNIHFRIFYDKLYQNLYQFNIHY